MLAPLWSLTLRTPHLVLLVSRFTVCSAILMAGCSRGMQSDTARSVLERVLANLEEIVEQVEGVAELPENRRTAAAEQAVANIQKIVKEFDDIKIAAEQVADPQPDERERLMELLDKRWLQLKKRYWKALDHLEPDMRNSMRSAVNGLDQHGWSLR